MKKIKKDTYFIEVLEEFEKCLDNDILLYDKDKFHNLKYSIQKMKNYLKEDKFENIKYNIKRYSSAFKYFYSFSENPYDVMLIDELNQVFRFYLFQKKYYDNYLGLDLEKITPLVKNPEKDIVDYDEILENNLDIKKEKYVSIQLTELINGNLLKCKVSQNQSLIIKDIEEQKDLKLNEGDEFFVFGRKGSFTMHHHHSNVSLINNLGENLKTNNIQAFIVAKDIIFNKDILNFNSNPKDLLDFQRVFYYNYSNVEIPLNWIKQKICQIEFDKKEYIVPIAIGSNNVEKELLITKINQDKNLELLIKLFNKKEISLEESKYLIEKDFDLCHYFKDMSEELKDFVLQQQNFSDQRLLRKLNLTQSNERDILFYESNISLKYLKEIRYKPSEEMIKKYLQRNGLELQYVENQTLELCLIAVKNKGTSLRFVKNKTLELCQEAVLNDPKAIKYVEEQFKKEIENFKPSNKKNKNKI